MLLILLSSLCNKEWGEERNYIILYDIRVIEGSIHNCLIALREEERTEKDKSAFRAGKALRFAWPNTTKQNRTEQN
jgi:hypothetical protein